MEVEDQGALVQVIGIVWLLTRPTGFHVEIIVLIISDVTGRNALMGRYSWGIFQTMYVDVFRHFFVLKKTNPERISNAEFSE